MAGVLKHGSTYIKTNSVIGLSKYICIIIDKNHFGIRGLFFDENPRLRPQGGPFVYISDFFEGGKIKFFPSISKQIAYFVSLNTPALQSIKVFCELIVYFSMKIKNSDHRRDPLYTFQIFSRVSKFNFFALYQNKWGIWSL